MIFVKHPGGSLLDNLPLLTQLADEAAPVVLPTLTEIVLPGSLPIIPAQAADEEKMSLLLQRLETHLEAVFAKKLNLALVQLQRQAVEQALCELKAELPELLRDALHADRKL